MPYGVEPSIRWIIEIYICGEIIGSGLPSFLSLGNSCWLIVSGDCVQRVRRLRKRNLSLLNTKNFFLHFEYFSIFGNQNSRISFLHSKKFHCKECIGNFVENSSKLYEVGSWKLRRWISWKSLDSKILLIKPSISSTWCYRDLTPGVGTLTRIVWIESRKQ